MAYATAQQVIDRAGAALVKLLADRDSDGVLSTAELAAISAETAEASRFIDGHLATHFTLPLTGSNLTNESLTDWTIWLATEQMYTRYGRVPDAVLAKADFVRQTLERVRLGQFRVPGMTYPGDGFTDERRALGVPVVVNPSRGRSRARRRYR